MNKCINCEKDSVLLSIKSESKIVYDLNINNVSVRKGFDQELNFCSKECIIEYFDNLIERENTKLKLVNNFANQIINENEDLLT